jgi:hypothetical protein
MICEYIPLKEEIVMNCPNCGAPIQTGDRFCQMCGSVVPENISAPTPNPIPPTNAGPTPPNRVGNFAKQTDPNTKVIRRWFKVKASKWPLLISLIGLFCCGGGGFFTFLGILMLVGGIALFFYLLINRNTSGQQEVDAAWNNQINILSSRALSKLNLVDEQTSLIDPVVTIGYGASPDSSFAISKATAAARKGLLRNLFGHTIGKLLGRLITDGTELDPYEAYRIGDDERVRSLLLEVDTYYFTDTQVLLYSADVDISTGLIYHEQTAEVFYEDIEGITFDQELFKVYNSKKKKYINKKRENMVLHLGGCKLTSSVNMDINDTFIDSQKQFSAMRNLIREKKN